jgi:hypothetical protein
VGVPGADGDEDAVGVLLPDLTAAAGLTAAVGVSLPDLSAGRGPTGSGARRGGRCVDAGVCHVRGRAQDRGHPPRPDRDPRAGFEGAAAAAVGVPGADGDEDGDAVGVSLPDLTAAVGLSAAVGVSLPDLTAGRGPAGSGARRGGRCIDAGVCRVRGRARDRGHPPHLDRDPRAGFEGASAAAMGVPGADGDGDAVGVSLPDLTAAGVGPTTAAGDGDGGAVEVCGVVMGRGGGGGSRASMAGNRGARAGGTVDPRLGKGRGGGVRRGQAAQCEGEAEPAVIDAARREMAEPCAMQIVDAYNRDIISSRDLFIYLFIPFYLDIVAYLYTYECIDLF